MITFSSLGNELYFGKLGNQLFEIASLIGISKQNGHGFYLKEWKYSKYFVNFDNMMVWHDLIPGTQEYKYDGTEYKRPDLTRLTNWDLKGYFQSERYFQNERDYLYLLFAPEVETNEDFKDYIGVHVRRGDYLQRAGYHVNLGMDYYEEAMSLFPNEKFLVYSDDIEWCKNNFNHDTCYFVKPTFDIMDMLFVSKCKGQIIANSSYSWWAAYFGELYHYTDRIIAPKNWFVNMDSKDLVPQLWERV